MVERKKIDMLRGIIKIRSQLGPGHRKMITLHNLAPTGMVKATDPGAGSKLGIGTMLDWQRSSQDALRFAFTTLGTPIVKISSINSMRGSSNFGEMTPQERHGQAAMIMACIERNVDIIEMAYLRAYYGNELSNGMYAKAVTEILVRSVIGALGTGSHPRRGIQKLVFNYFGQDIPISTIRRDLGCSLDNANRKRSIVYDTLSDIGTRADNNAELALYNSGLIE